MNKKYLLFYHPFQWQIKKHTGHNGTRYLQDMDIKPKWIIEVLRKEKITYGLKKAKPLSWEEYKSVHKQSYVESIRKGDSREIVKYSWITWSKSFLRAQLYIGGSIYDSSKSALKKGVSGAIVTEGHHAKLDHGSGFGTFHHLAAAVNKLLKEKNVSKVAIIDCDFHLGDGTLDIFKNNTQVRILDLYGVIHKGGKKITTNNSKLIKIKNKDQYLSSLKKYIGQFIVCEPDLVYIAERCLGR
jgi:acetoin utilization deacetylase AcuC-like enzyme